MEGDRPAHTAQGPKGGVPHTSAFCYTTQPIHCAPALPAPAHTPGQQGRGWGTAEELNLRCTAPTCFKSLQSATQLCQWGHSKNLHTETPRASEGFTNKVQKFQNTSLDFLFPMNRVEISTVPFQVIFGIRLYLSTEGTEEGKKSLRSNWKDSSTNGSMKNKNIKQGADVCLEFREGWQTKDRALQYFTKSLHTCKQSKDSIKSLCIWQMENMTFLLFGGYEWERIENISAEKAEKHVSSSSWAGEPVCGFAWEIFLLFPLDFILPVPPTCPHKNWELWGLKEFKLREITPLPSGFSLGLERSALQGSILSTEDCLAEMQWWMPEDVFFWQKCYDVHRWAPCPKPSTNLVQVYLRSQSFLNQNQAHPRSCKEQTNKEQSLYEQAVWGSSRKKYFFSFYVGHVSNFISYRTDLSTFDTPLTNYNYQNTLKKWKAI